MPCGGRCRRNGLGVFGFNGRAPSIVAQCHSEGVLLPHLRHVAVVVPSQCGFRLRPMRGGCRRRCLVPNRLSLMISYYDTPVRFVLFDSAARVGTLPGRHATHKEGERRTTASFFVAAVRRLAGSTGCSAATFLFTKELGDRNHSVTESFFCVRVFHPGQRERVPAGMLRFTVSWRRASFTTSFLRFTRV